MKFFKICFDHKLLSNPYSSRILINSFFSLLDTAKFAKNIILPIEVHETYLFTVYVLHLRQNISLIYIIVLIK